VKPYQLFGTSMRRPFMLNERDLTDLGRFTAVLSALSGRRLTWNALTGR
jgi:hypothetical protein